MISLWNSLPLDTATTTSCYNNLERGLNTNMRKRQKGSYQSKGQAATQPPPRPEASLATAHLLGCRSGRSCVPPPSAAPLPPLLVLDFPEEAAVWLLWKAEHSSRVCMSVCASVPLASSRPCIAAGILKVVLGNSS